MSKHVLSCLAVIAIASIVTISSPVGARALEQAPPPQAPTIVPLKVDVTIQRFEGDKKISNLPYSLTVNASSRNGNTTSMAMGAQVPFPTAGADGKPAGWQYRQIGTSINCSGAVLEGGRFQLSLNIDDTSLVPDQGRGGAASGVPTFKNFNTQTTPILRDGQTMQFVAATDKISGETVKVEVTINSIK